MYSRVLFCIQILLVLSRVTPLTNKNKRIKNIYRDTELVLPMYNVHPYFSLKNLGKKVHIIRSRIQVSHVPHCRGEQVQGARVDQNLIILERLGRDRRTVRKRSPRTHTHTHTRTRNYTYLCRISSLLPNFEFLKGKD